MHRHGDSTAPSTLLTYHPIAPVISISVIVAAFLLFFLFVVLPAIWSNKPARRRAARAVLQQILDFLLAFAHHD
jgi:hypothetical protein